MEPAILFLLVLLFIIIIILLLIVVWYQTNYLPPSACEIPAGRYFTAPTWNYNGIKEERRVQDLNEAQNYCNSLGSDCQAFVWSCNSLRMFIVDSFGPDTLNQDVRFRSGGSNGTLLVKS